MHSLKSFRLPVRMGSILRIHGSIDRLLHSAWILLSLSLLLYVFRFGRNIPMWEEWYYVPVFFGESPWWEWIFGRLHEHRFVLGRVLWLIGFHLSGGDFRAGMVLNVFFLSASAWILCRVARQLRGEAHFSDLLILALLLNPAGWENLLLGYQVAFTLDVLLAALLVLLAGHAPHLKPGTVALAAGVLVFALSLGGWIGLAFVPVGVMWVAYMTWQHWRKTGNHLGSLTRLVLPAMAAAWFAFCYLEVAAHPMVGRTPNAFLTQMRVCLEFLSTGFGPLGDRIWPVSGGLSIVWLGMIVIWLAMRWFQDPSARPMILGWLVVLSAVGLMGYGLGKWRPNGFAARNFPLSAGLTIIGLLIFAKWGPDLSHRRRIVNGLVVVLIVFTLYHGWRVGLHSGRQWAEWHKQYERDRASGLPLPYLASRHLLFPHPELPESLRVLRDHQHPAGRNLPDAEPTFRENVPIPDATHELIPGDPLASVLRGKPQSWYFPLGKERKLTGVRVTFRYQRTSIRVPIQILFPSAASGSPQLKVTGCNPWLSPFVWTLDFWVDQPVDRFWLRTLDAADHLEILEVQLLVPASR